MAVLIERQLLGAGAATVTFTAIPATFSNLLLLIDARGDQAANTINANIQFNNDSGANYDLQYILGNAATPSAAELLAQVSLNICSVPAANAGANLSSSAQILIPNYARTTFQKTLMSQWNRKIGTATTNLLSVYLVGFWRSTAAISEIDILASAGNFIANSLFELYGI